MNRIFVYGTLRRSGVNDRLLRTSKLVGAAKTRTNFSLYDLGEYPAIVRGGHALVSGEVYDVDDQTLAEIDLLEEHPEYYRREVIQIEPHGEAWIYVLTRPEALPETATLIVSGDWFKRRT